MSEARSEAPRNDEKNPLTSVYSKIFEISQTQFEAIFFVFLAISVGSATYLQFFGAFEISQVLLVRSSEKILCFQYWLRPLKR